MQAFWGLIFSLVGSFRRNKIILLLHEGLPQFFRHLMQFHGKYLSSRILI